MPSHLVHSEIFRERSSSSANYHPYHHAKKQQQLQQVQLSQHHDARYYASCYLAGGLSSGIRWILSPLELVKTRLQAASGSSAGMVGTFSSIYALEGARGLFRGLGPTAVAYWFQTSTKYGLYEVFKDQLTVAAMKGRGSSEQEVHRLYKGLIYVTAAATAEAVADVLMCPWEMIKVKLQTTATGSTGNSFPTRFGPALAEMLRCRKLHNFPFGSLGPLWSRQIPGTVVNFYAFESAVAAIYSCGGRPKQDYSAAQQLGVTFAAGNLAGTCCAVVSHPADSIISLKSLPEHAGQSALQIARRVGGYRLATKGLAPRILVTGQIISVQWLLYDSIKSVLGFGTTGGNA